MNLAPFALLWTALALETLALLLWNRTIAADRQDRACLLARMPAAEGRRLAHGLERMDRWSRRLTGMTVVFGAARASAWLYRG